MAPFTREQTALIRSLLVAEAEEGFALSLKEVELSRGRFSAGLATNIEVTDAQTAVAKARDNVIEALFNFNVARIHLAHPRSTGTYLSSSTELFPKTRLKLLLVKRPVEIFSEMLVEGMDFNKKEACAF